MRFFLLLLFLLPASGISIGQNKLDGLIAEALENNIVLKEKRLSLQKSLLALREAKSLFLPSTNFEGSYVLSAGGRSIQIPVGDLLNPVYQTLNQLTSSTKFPTIQNVSEQFLPNNFYDTRIRTTMPLYNPALRAQEEISNQGVRLKQNEVEQYKRELVLDVKLAYYRYLSATGALNIYTAALETVMQNVKLNRSLLANGKGLPAYVSRAESEASAVQNQLRSAQNEQQNAMAYFNFLSNKPLDQPIPGYSVSEPDSLLQEVSVTITEADAREELLSLKILQNMNEQVQKLDRSFRVPRVSAFADIGSQGFDFRFNDQTLFYFAGLQVSFPIFNGGRNLNKINQTKLDGESLALQAEQTRRQLVLAITVSRNNVLTAYNGYHTALKQTEAARQYFKLIQRGYSEGINNFLEFLDSRSQLTRSEVQLNISKYQFASSIADYERQTSSYNFQKHGL